VDEVLDRTQYCDRIYNRFSNAQKNEAQLVKK